MKKGTLIVFEGLDGSGKNTQANLLVGHLKEKFNKKANFLAFPNYKSRSSALVQMYLNSEFGSNPGDVNVYAATSFFAVDRYASFKKEWESRYLNGEVFICDRYTTSNTYYQMGKLPKSKWEDFLNWNYDFEYEKLGLPRPDAVIFLDMPVGVSQELMTERYEGDESKKDLHEANVSYLKKCEKAAKFTSEKDNWIRIDCLEKRKIKSRGKIHKEVLSVLSKKIAEIWSCK